jgi:SAM-dependent methyltransferase
MRGNVRMHDLTKPLPYAENSVDMVYHSHVLEHIRREDRASFLKELLRVLKPGGVHRAVVPNLSALARAYIDSFERAMSGRPDWATHEERVVDLLEQMVREEPAGLSCQSKIVRIIERIVVGDARRRGEVHRWMYDDVSLPGLLRDVGFDAITIEVFNKSRFSHWAELGLEVREDGKAEYKPGSLYVECEKPGRAR